VFSQTIHSKLKVLKGMGHDAYKLSSKGSEKFN
jgi:hypothetical protein